MDSETQQAVLAGNIEALTQGCEFVESLSDAHYIKICAPHVSSSIGEHIRHVLDMYHSLEAGLRVAVIDYDSRRRGDAVEFTRQKAIEEFRYFIAMLNDVSERDLRVPISVKTEVSLTGSVSITVLSNLMRELVFVASHAVHHYALINAIARLQNIELTSTIGVAPATASYLRSKNVCAQ